MAFSLPTHIFPQKTPTAGTGLFTSKPLPAGELIFRLERPLVSVLDSVRLRDTCEGCFRWLPASADGRTEDAELTDGGEGGKGVLRDCLGCKVVRYCCKVGFYILDFFCVGLLEDVFGCAVLISSVFCSELEKKKKPLDFSDYLILYCHICHLLGSYLQWLRSKTRPNF